MGELVLPLFVVQWIVGTLGRGIAALGYRSRQSEEAEDATFWLADPRFAVLLHGSPPRVLRRLAACPHTHVISLAGAFIPGVGSPLHVLLGGVPDLQRPTVRVLRCNRGEPETPSVPERGPVWRACSTSWDTPGRTPWTTTRDLPRAEVFDFLEGPHVLRCGGWTQADESLDTWRGPSGGEERPFAEALKLERAKRAAELVGDRPGER